MPQGIWALLLLLVFVVAEVNTELAFGATEHRPFTDTTTHNQKFIKSFEKHLLAMFGLGSRPKPKRNTTISDYMWELYNKQNKLHRGGRYTRTNTIRCFRAQEKGQKNSDDPLRARFKFDVDSIPEHEDVWSAELVVYRPPWNEKENSAKSAPVHRLQVYDVVNPATKKSEALLRLVDTRVLKSRRGGWESFDVLPALHRWKWNSSTNHGLYVEVASSLNASSSHPVRLKRSTDESHEQWLQWMPLLVTYSRDSSLSYSEGTRTRRSTRKHRRKGKKENCRRHALYVDFSDVGWNDWIVAPPGYDAYYCQGDCPYPLADHLNSTNHAIVQTLVNSVNPKAVPRACCVPTELSPISMLYVDEYDKIVLKNYQDMVVEGCGCR